MSTAAHNSWNERFENVMGASKIKVSVYINNNIEPLQLWPTFSIISKIIYVYSVCRTEITILLNTVNLLFMRKNLHVEGFILLFSLWSRISILCVRCIVSSSADSAPETDDWNIEFHLFFVFRNANKFQMISYRRKNSSMPMLAPISCFYF